MANSNVSDKPLLEKIWDLLELEPESSDVAFCVGKEKKIVRAVKIILKASSPVLKNELEKWEVAGIKKRDEIPFPDFDPSAFELFVKITTLDTWSLESLKALNLPLNQILNLLLICRRFGMKAAEENLRILATSTLFLQSFGEDKDTYDFLQLSHTNNSENLINPGISRLGSTRGLKSAKNSPIVCDESQTIRWGKRINGFPPRSEHAAVAVGNSVYSFGGWNSCDERYSKDVLDVFVLNTDDWEKKWKKLSVKNIAVVNPNQRHGHSAVAHKQFVLIFGGFEKVDATKFEYSNSTYRLNTNTLKWYKPKVTGIVPATRSHHTAFVLRNKMFVYGGLGYEVTNDLIHSLDLESFRWSTIETKGIPPSLCYGHTATVHDDRFILIFGGRDIKEGEYLNSIYSFDLRNKTWTAVETSETPPSIRKSHSAFVHNRQMYIFGGSDIPFYFNDMFRYDPETREWEKVTPNGEAPSPRHNAGCVALNNQVFIFGGEEGFLEFCGDTWVLQM